MNYSNEFINNLIDNEISFCHNLRAKYHYPDNIIHLLYIIIPAFILKYGLNNRKIIEECFMNIQIIIDDKQDKVYQAYYFSFPRYVNGQLVTQKNIVLNNYQNIGLMQLLDNLVHEFNHAINSYQNEIKINDFVLIRTGLVYNYFDKKSLTFIKKGIEITLEEVINTKQTEKVIDIIKSFSTYSINNTTITSTLYSIYHSIKSNYHSNSYLLESYFCKNLLENRTFLSTIESLRLEGNIDDIEYFFNSVLDDDKAFTTLSISLNKSLKLQKELINTKWLRKYKLYKIKKLNDEIKKIVDKFSENTIFK